MDKKTPREETLPPRLLPIEWPETGVGLFANHLLAVADGSSSYLTFCQVSPPIVTGTQEERSKQLERMQSIKAEPVARIVVPIGALRQMVKTLQTHLELIEYKDSDDVRSDT